MENIEDLPEEVFDLLSAKKYEQFSTQELELLEQYFSKEDIKSYSVLVQDFLSLDSLQEEAFDIENLPVLEPQTQATVSRSILTRQIPLYQAVAAAVIVLVVTVGAFSIFGNQNLPIAKEGQNRESNGVQFIHNQDPKTLSTDSMLLQKSKGKSLLEENYPEEIVFTL